MEDPNAIFSPSKLTDDLSLEGFQGPVLCPVCETGYLLYLVVYRRMNGADMPLYFEVCCGKDSCQSEQVGFKAAKKNKQVMQEFRGEKS